MPYRGIPSKGCTTCRKRKIRCDQRTPTCGNCEKAQRECLGYRDTTDMMFLDETHDVTKKMQGITTYDLAGSASRRASRMPAKVQVRSEKDLVKLEKLPVEIETQAMTFFFTHFAPRTTFDKEDGDLFSNVSPQATTASEQSLYNAVLALGLVGLARFPPLNVDAPLSSYAEAKYLAAITVLNKAISDPLEVQADATLLAVLILTIYETLSLPPSNPQSPSPEHIQTLTAWSNHVDGAAALLAARGSSQFEGRHGIRLFVQTAIPFCINCMQRGQQIPDIITDLLVEANASAPADPTSPIYSPLWRGFEFSVKFSAFFGNARTRQIIDLPTIVNIASSLDMECTNLIDSMIDLSEVHTIYSSDLPSLPPTLLPLGYCTAYPNFTIAELCNGMRAMRIQLNQLVRSCLLIGMTHRPPLFATPKHTALLQHTTDTLTALSEAVVASVPQYLGHLTGPDTPHASPSPSSLPSTTPKFLWTHFPPATPTHRDSLPLVRSMGGCHIPWALLMVAAADTCTPERHEWVVARLVQIAEDCGVRQAAVLAERAQAKAWGEGWWRGVCPLDGKGWRATPTAVTGGGAGDFAGRGGSVSSSDASMSSPSAAAASVPPSIPLPGSEIS